MQANFVTHARSFKDHRGSEKRIDLTVDVSAVYALESRIGRLACTTAVVPVHWYCCVCPRTGLRLEMDTMY